MRNNIYPQAGRGHGSDWGRARLRGPAPARNTNITYAPRLSCSGGPRCAPGRKFIFFKNQKKINTRANLSIICVIVWY